MQEKGKGRKIRKTSEGKNAGGWRLAGYDSMTLRLNDSMTH